MAKIERLEYEYRGLSIPCHLYTTRSDVDTLELLEYVYWAVEDCPSRSQIMDLSSDPNAPIKWGWDLGRAADHLLRTGQLGRVARGVYCQQGLSPKPRLLPSPTPCKDLICAKAASGNTDDIEILCSVLNDPGLLHRDMA